MRSFEKVFGKGGLKHSLDEHLGDPFRSLASYITF